MLSRQVRFLDKDWKNHLIEEIGEENIFMHWGGVKKHEHPCGDIRMGGKVPESLWYVEKKYRNLWIFVLWYLLLKLEHKVLPNQSIFGF